MLSAIDVQVLEPEIDGDTVRFRWEQSAPLAIHPGTELTFRYDGIDLGQFAPELLLEVFLAMQLRIFKRANVPVHLKLPRAMPETSVAFWQTYHGAWNVDVSPISASTSYEPFSSPERIGRRQYPVAIYFGGGRDSLCAACLLGEIFGRENVLLITYLPIGNQRRVERYERLLLQPAEALGFPVQRVRTNLRANVKSQNGERALPYLEEYSAGSLPALLQHGARFGTFCHAWVDYFSVERSDGTFRHTSQRSRPDWLGWQSRHYQRAIHFDHTVSNVNMSLHGQFAVRILSQRYPQAIANIMMCHGTSQSGRRWCHDCDKCFNWLRQCLAEGWNDPGFDFNAFMEGSRWVESFIARAAACDEITSGGNLVWQPFMDSLSSHPLFCRTLYLDDPSVISDRLSRDGELNLMTIKAMYGNEPFSELDCIPQSAIDSIAPELGRPLQAIIQNYCPINPGHIEPFAVNGCRFIYDLAPIPGNPLASLAHLQ